MVDDSTWLKLQTLGSLLLFAGTIFAGAVGIQTLGEISSLQEDIRENRCVPVSMVGEDGLGSGFPGFELNNSSMSVNSSGSDPAS